MIYQYDTALRHYNNKKPGVTKDKIMQLTAQHLESLDKMKNNYSKNGERNMSEDKPMSDTDSGQQYIKIAEPWDP